jgi:acetyl esterase/lipase
MTFCLASLCFARSPGEEAFLKLAGRENDGVVIPLWPGNGIAPSASRTSLEEEVETPRVGATRIKTVRKPSIIVVPPPAGVAQTGVTILFAPGGGYGILSLPNAVDICNWAGAMGAHCAVLKYCVPRDREDPGHRVPLADAQRAMRLLRAKADDLKIDADKIIMVGSSAGGHLTFNLANNHGEKTYEAIDAADEFSERPSAAVLMYPAYLTQPTQSLTADPHLQLDKLSTIKVDQQSKNRSINR